MDIENTRPTLHEPSRQSNRLFTNAEDRMLVLRQLDRKCGI
jgi:hypothetical protein